MSVTTQSDRGEHTVWPPGLYFGTVDCPNTLGGGGQIELLGVHAAQTVHFWDILKKC